MRFRVFGCVCVFTVSICADSASREPIVTRGMSHVKVCSPGELRCALIHVGSRDCKTKTSTSAGSKSLTGAFPCFWVCVCVCLLFQFCADSASREPIVTRGTSHVKVFSPGELRCALIHVGSRGRQTKTSTSAGSKSLTGAFPCLLGVCMCVYCFNLCRFSKQ